MLRLRKSKERVGWKQGKALDSIATLMAGQVRSAMGGPDVTTDGSPMEYSTSVNAREVVSVLTPSGETRQISLRPPTEADWALLEVARHVRGERDAHKATWCSFATMVLCAAQAETGMFDLVKISRERSVGFRRNQGLRPAHGLVLSPEASEAIKRDLDKWLRMGFVAEPMVVEPVEGDYLTVKHRGVAGGRGPMGIKTQARGTTAWEVASRVMAGTPWVVPQGTLEFLRTDLGKELAQRSEPDESRRALIEGSYRRLATEAAIYLPIFMDFRGRTYTKPNVVTYQGGDLQKSLLVFPQGPIADYGREALARHCGNLYGHGMDKAPMAERLKWFEDAIEDYRGGIIHRADEPLQLFTAMNLISKGRSNQVPCQIDGTCNGLQHLTALFRDETAAPFVNLAGSTDKPSDIYGAIAARVKDRLQGLAEEPGGSQGGWARRVLAAVTIDRKLCKKPVMVLPYGGTRGTIEEAVMEAVLDQQLMAQTDKYLKGSPQFNPWTECLTVTAKVHDEVQWGRDPDVDPNYLAFRDREMRNHPLLRLDCQRLGGIVWSVIEEVLPRPMQAMQAFRDIAKAVGDRALEWSTGYGPNPLWVVQAKAVSASTKLSLKGMHLPGSVRGLKMRSGRDEVDPTSHVSGIVANFIHSQDADHQTRTMDLFARPCFGGIFDCYITRPSLIGNLGHCARCGFLDKYGLEDAHPLRQPVRVRDIKTGDLEEYPNWFALAEAVGVTFPEMGTWEPDAVLESEWFFS